MQAPARIMALAALVLGAGAAAAQMPPWLARAWPETDFDRITVDPGEIVSGGVPRDGIPAISDPEMVPATGADLPGREPVMVVELAGQRPRAYPLRYLTWHEIVNDRIDGLPLAVTFCPLCNSGLVFDRRVAGEVLDVAVSGLLRFSDLIMYDRQTFSLWQQFGGEAIAGTLAGTRLDLVPSRMEPWSAFAAANPHGLVMVEPKRHRRPYGTNPYAGYDSLERPVLHDGAPPPHGIPALARVVRVGDRAWPLDRVAEAGAIEEAGLRITWRPGMASALDAARIAEGRDVGAIRVQDAATGRDVAHEVVFAFAFHAFHPDGTWMLGDRAP